MINRIFLLALCSISFGCTEMICDMVRDCNLPVSAPGKTVFVSMDQINDHFGSVYIRQGVTGERVCSELGYSSCVAAQFLSTTSFYASTDLSCTGGKQVENKDNVLLPCDYGEVTYSDCGNAVAGYAEPKLGDAKGTRILSGTLCIE